MDKVKALDLAKHYVPNSAVAFNKSALNISQAAQKLIDTNQDNLMSQEELAMALQKDKIKLDTQKSKVSVNTAPIVEMFADEDSAPVRPKNQFSGPTTLGIGKTKTQVEVSESTETYMFNKDLDLMVKEVNNPDQVAALLNDINYNDERGKPLGGDGPLGTQKPEDTLAMFDGVCRDIHQLGAYILSANGYDAVQVGYTANRTSHSFLTYRPAGAKGYGVIEYGRNYSPEAIEKILGRPALSPKEALLALRPEAKMIFGWTPPKKGEEGSVKDIFYTFGHQLYQQSLKLNHKDSVSVDRNKGIEIEKTLGKHWSVKAGVNFDSPGDPTAKGAAHVAAGYQWGNFDNWGRVSVGAQYRPNEGNHLVGPNTWRPNPTFLAGASIDGKVTPFKYEFSPNHWTKSVLYGNLSGAFLALNKDKASDAGKIVDGDVGYDLDMITGLHQGNLRLSQQFGGYITPNLTYEAEVFNDFDISLMVPAYMMGGTGYYANVGANAMLKYYTDPLALYLGGQVMFHQVNNRDTNAVITGMDFKKGPLQLGSNMKFIPSEEGNRFVFNQYANIILQEDPDSKDPKLYIGAQAQETMNLSHDDKTSIYSNPGDYNLGFTLGGSF